MKKIFLNIQHRAPAGSVEHYYHFLLGFLMPLVDRLTHAENEIYVIRSCGPLDTIIRSLPVASIEIIDKFTHKKLPKSQKIMTI